jgi:hypothetical protein
VEDDLADKALRFGGGPATSNMTWASLVILLAAICLFFFLVRKYLVVVFVLVSTFIPYYQVLVIGGLHFQSSRVLLPFAWFSIKPLTLLKSHPFKWNGVDRFVVFYGLATTIAGFLLWGDWGVLANRMGLLYNLFGTYFLLRLILTSRDDVQRTIRLLAILCVLIAMFMVVEQRTGRNVFSIFGGVPDFTPIREGRVRSQAAFAHAIVAGTVGATLLPLFVGLWFQGKKWRGVAAVGVVAGLVMTITSASATPMLALVGGMIALCLWPLRRQLRSIRWGVLVTLVCLHLIMKAPVWALIQRIDIVGGSSGWHRYELIDESIRHFWDWWLVGVKNPSSWGYYMGDLSNAYMSEAVKGGLLSLVTFIGIIWQGFRRLGTARKRAAVNRNRPLELLLWAFGATLFSNAVAFIGIWYFDQSFVIWFTVLAMICAITSVSGYPTSECKVARTSRFVLEGIPEVAEYHGTALRNGYEGECAVASGHRLLMEG